jgi:hypothetical protein
MNANPRRLQRAKSSAYLPGRPGRRYAVRDDNDRTGISVAARATAASMRSSAAVRQTTVHASDLSRRRRRRRAPHAPAGVTSPEGLPESRAGWRAFAPGTLGVASSTRSRIACSSPVIHLPGAHVKDLIAFRDACWYSLTELTASLGKPATYRFKWLLPGHGWLARVPAGQGNECSLARVGCTHAKWLKSPNSPLRREAPRIRQLFSPAMRWQGSATFGRSLAA